MALKIMTPHETFTTEDYPEAVEFAKRQAHIVWVPEEINMEKDLQDLRSNLTPNECYGVIYVLRIFTLLELKIGSEYWGTYVAKFFPRPEIQRMAATFSFFELGVHGPFYNRINELLGLDTEEFYNEYKKDPVLSNRMNWIGKRISKSETTYDKLRSVGAFSMIEGAILYSSFAFLKHFNNNGKNKLSNLNAGINYSANDEAIHSEGGAWLFRTVLEEALEEGEISLDELSHLKEELYETAGMVLKHESVINSNIFNKDPNGIENINPQQLDMFVASRLNIVLKSLGLEGNLNEGSNPIAKWFYNDVNSSTLHDFFVSQGNDYNRNWNEQGFVW
jgi:ribonucleotide reductase beta subunit family protein with ferritin-like domain